MFQHNKRRIHYANLRGTVFFKIGILLTGFTFIIKNKVNSHPTKQLAESLIISDPRVVDYLGEDIKVKPSWVNFFGDHLRFKLKLKGSRGSGRVLVKYNQVRHSDLIDFSTEQMAYSKLKKEEKEVRLFKPIDFNNAVIPSEKTISIIKNLIKSNSDNPFPEKTEKNINQINYENVMHILDKKIENDDTFYFITSIFMMTDDDSVFHIHPSPGNFRSYDIEDSIYTFRYYKDVFKKDFDLKFKHSKQLLYLKNRALKFNKEKIVNRESDYSHMIEIQKQTAIATFILSFCFTLIYFIYSKWSVKVNQNTFYLFKNLLTKGDVSLYKFTPLCIEYKQQFFRKVITCEGLLTNEKGHLYRFQFLSKDSEAKLKKNEKIFEPLPIQSSYL